MPSRIRPLAALAVLALIAVACGPGPSASGSVPSTSCLPTGAPGPAASAGCATPAASVVMTELKVGLGYIPSVQFAPFYLAQQQGLYRDAGLEVAFENKIDPDLLTLVGYGGLDMGVADGTSVIPGVSQQIPVRYLATIYGTFPSIVFAKKTSGIQAAADLKGRKIGIPGKYGSSWIMLQALLKSAGLTTSDAEIVEYPDFGQGIAVQQGAVDAATGFANNEPVQLELAGVETVVLHVDDVVALPGPGLIANGPTLDLPMVRFAQVTVEAMRIIAADPELGLEAAIAAVPELAAQRETQAAILAATIATWAPQGGGPEDFGSIDRDGWQASIDYLTELGLVPNPVSLNDVLMPEPDCCDTVPAN